MRKTALLGCVTALIVGLGATVPLPAEAQSVVGKIKRAAKQKVEDQKRRTEQGIVQEAVEPLDSTLAKGARPVEGAVARTTAHVDSAVSKAERAVAESFTGENAEVRRIAEALHEQGHVVLDRVSFVPASDALDTSSEAQLMALAHVLSKETGTFLIQGQAPSQGAKLSGKGRATKRAEAIKVWLIGAGVPPSRLLATGGEGSADQMTVLPVN